jgi:CO dehydrogenase maturation factor
MKIAITGKGGAGKTTVTAGLALTISKDKQKVIVIDCDPDANLGLSLGFSNAENITPVSELKSLIAERTEVESLDTPTTFFKLNPQVDDIPDKYAVEKDGVKLLVMGKVCKAGGGCMCPENTFIKSLVSHLVLKKGETVILDMVAGSEHLGRATAKNVDAFLIVAEPTQTSIATALRIKKLSAEMGIKNIFFVGNKIRAKADEDFLKKELKDNFLGFVPFSKTLEENRGKFVFDAELKKSFEDIYQELTEVK